MKKSDKTNKKTTMFNRVLKGEAGYIRYRQKQLFLITFLMFALPLGLFIIGYTVTGTRANLMTFFAIMGCLPACRYLVALVMILLQKPADPSVVKAVEKVSGDLIHAYELVLTAEEKNTVVNAAVVCGNQIVCYTPDPKADVSYAEKHITRIMNSNQFFDMQVRVMKDLKAYCQRVQQLSADPEKYRAGISFTPDERYPDFSREELIMHLLLRISL